jgi:hypothetical protein
MFEGDISTITPLGLAFTLVMGVLMYVLPRRYAPIPMIMVGCYITLGQMVYVAGLHFSVMRIIILIGWLRVFTRREYGELQFNKIDKAFLAWAFANVIIYNIQWQTYDALINRLGFLYNATGLYFLFRCLIRNLDEVMHTIKMLAFIILPFAMLMLYEKTTGHNMFSVFGGVPEYTVVRDDRLRCQGPFRHPILAGTLGATLMPCFVGLWSVKGARLIALLGLASATIITVTAASSGPVVAYASGLLALAIWPMRDKMRIVRWGVLLVLIVVQIFMKAPVWYLIGRLSEFVGGTGWHRAEIIDQAVNHFDEWWLVGSHYTAHWMPYVMPDNPDMADITSQYIMEGLIGGVLTMMLFIVLIARSFQLIGTAVNSTQNRIKGNKYAIWALGAALFAHVISFMSVVYFDQMVVFWFMMLSIISAASMASIKQ